MLNLPHSPATKRNREPIYSVLSKYLNNATTVLEIAAGTGEHAAWIAPKLPFLTWQPSDQNSNTLGVIDAYNSNNKNVLTAIHLDVQKEWPKHKYDIIMCINMIHIAPWSCCEALMSNAKKHLSENGLLYLYGPYQKNGIHTAPSNDDFDRWLREQNPQWGVRNMEDVIREAEQHSFQLRTCVPMPANNFSLLFTC